MYVFRRPWDRARRRRTLTVPTVGQTLGLVGAGIAASPGVLIIPRLGWGVVSQSIGAFPAPYLFGTTIQASAGNLGINQVTNATVAITGAGSIFNAGDPLASWSSTGSLSPGVGSLFAAGTVTAIP